eukprot:6411901-Pyramimonas_sp.AAC.1
MSSQQQQQQQRLGQLSHTATARPIRVCVGAKTSMWASSRFERACDALRLEANSIRSERRAGDPACLLVIGGVRASVPPPLHLLLRRGCLPAAPSSAF